MISQKCMKRLSELDVHSKTQRHLKHQYRYYVGLRPVQLYNLCDVAYYY